MMTDGIKLVVLDILALPSVETACKAYARARVNPNDKAAQKDRIRFIKARAFRCATKAKLGLRFA